MKPDVMLTISRPDEIAECWGVSPALYEKLWSLVPKYPESEGEWPEPGVNNAALFWKEFTKEEKAELNKRAKEVLDV